MAFIETYVEFKGKSYKVTIDNIPSRTLIYFFNADIVAPYGGQYEFDAAGKWVKKEWNYPPDHIDLVKKLEKLLQE